MEGFGQYDQFFRFRSPARIAGETDSAGWLFDSIEYIDFTEDVLIDESIAISQWSFGAFKYRDLRELDFQTYDRIVMKCAKEMNEENDG